MGNVPWNWIGIHCYGMGMGQINMSHGQPCFLVIPDTNRLRLRHKQNIFPRVFRCAFYEMRTVYIYAFAFKVFEKNNFFVFLIISASL